MTYSSATLLIVDEDPTNIPLLEPDLTDGFEIPPWATFQNRTCKNINNRPCNEKGACMMLIQLRQVIDAFNQYSSINIGRVILHGKNIETSITGNASYLFFSIFWQLAVNSSCMIYKKNLAIIGRQYSYSADLDDIFYKFYSAHITRALLLNKDISITNVKNKIRERFQELIYYTNSLLDIVKHWELKDASKNALVFMINALSLMLNNIEEIEEKYRVALENIFP